MRIEVKVSREGQRSLNAMLKSDRWLRRVMDEATLLVARRIERYAKRGAPVRTGGGRRGIDVTDVRDGHAIVAPIHMLVMEEGRMPGAAMPPVEPLERWGRRVLGERGLGFVLARSIARKGIAPRRFFAAAVGQATGPDRDKLQRGIARILRRHIKEAGKSG